MKENIEDIKMADLSVYKRVKTPQDYERENHKRMLEEQALQAKIQFAERGGGTTPATIRIADEVQKALSSGDVQRANLLLQIQKTVDRGVLPYGEGNSIPNQGMSPQNMDMPSILDEGATAPMPAGIAPKVNYAPQAMRGYGDAVGSIAATKVGMEQQAKSDIDLKMQPIIEGQKTLSKARAATVAGKEQELPGQASKITGQLEKTDLVSGLIDKAKTQAGFFSTGMPGAITQYTPGIGGFDLKLTLGTIKSVAGFDKLQEIKDNSKTGGALGPVSDFENKLLQSTWGNIEQSQGNEQFLENLSIFKKQYQQSWERVRKAYIQDYGSIEGFEMPGSFGDTTPQELKKYNQKINPSNIPMDAVRYLRQNPQLVDAFDKKYGSGASKMVLGK